MKTVMNRKFIALLVLVSTFVLPVAAFAQDDPNADAGTFITLGLIGLILALLAVVAVIGAVSLGIIGIGWTLSQSE